MSILSCFPVGRIEKPFVGAGEGGGEGRESVREGKVASAHVVCGDAEMPLPDIIS